MDAQRPLRGVFDRYQQRHTPLAVPVAVVKKFGDDDGGDLAALIAFRAFFSLFPLLLLLTTVLGYVLAGNPDLRQEAVDSTLAQFPVIGDQIRLSSLEGNGIALAVGIVGSLWAGFGVVLATEGALDRVWAVPRRDRSGFLASRLRALTLLLVLGALAIASTVASGLAAAISSPTRSATRHRPTAPSPWFSVCWSGSSSARCSLCSVPSSTLSALPRPLASQPARSRR